MAWLDRRDDLRPLILKDVNYTEESFKEDVNRLREWLKLQPHLPQFLSDHILEVFLLASKSLQRSKDKLDSYYTARATYPMFFPKEHPRHLFESTKAINLFYLPKVTEDAHRIMIISINENVESFSIDFKDYLVKIYLLADYWYTFGPLSSGAMVMIDLSNFKPSLVPKFLSSPIKSFIKLGQEINPLRGRKIIFYNTPSSVTKIVQLIMSYANPKFSQRIAFVNEGDFESLHKIVPKSILPKDYGGDECTSSELTEKWTNAIINSNDWCEQLNLARSDESKRLGEPNSRLANLNFGVEGTFKKLTID